MSSSVLEALRTIWGLVREHMLEVKSLIDIDQQTCQHADIDPSLQPVIRTSAQISTARVIEPTAPSSDVFTST